MSERFIIDDTGTLIDMQTRDAYDYVSDVSDLLNELNDENEQLKEEKEKWKSNCSSAVNENSILWNEISILREQGAEPSEAFQEFFLKLLKQSSERLKLQLYRDNEERVCNICKHHYLVNDDESEWGYYNSRCKKGHNYECARGVSLKYCEDFEKEVEE